MFNLKYIYSIIFFTLSAWVVYAYLTTTEIIQSQETYAHIINISGKQRMLSQKTALIAKRYYETGEQQLKIHLIDLRNQMERDHDEIVNQYMTSKRISDIYLQTPINLNNKIDEYLSLLSYFIKNRDFNSLEKIETFSFELLPFLNETVYIYESESNEKTRDLMDREFFILIGTLLTLVFEAVIIVIPAIRLSARKNSELKKLVEERTSELEKLSVTDQLTGLYNRRKIDEILEAELEQARRYDYSFSLILVDIDHFKKVNDSYGHQTGDLILQTVARIFSTNVRKADLVARWGGEEFLIVCLEKDFSKVSAFAEKLRALIEKHEFDIVKNITCSFGVSHFTPGDDMDSLLLRADIALYKAKDSGRNKVVVNPEIEG